MKKFCTKYDGVWLGQVHRVVDEHCRGRTHVHCGNQLCCWGPRGKREPCPRYRKRRSA